ncbi:MAG: hypothetical protein KC657_39485 [Myxococcales bacterium]|nr:hypothetical protein [Myxococcales bacterium]
MAIVLSAGPVALRMQRVLVFQDADGQHRYQFCLEDRVLAAWLETLEHEVNKKTA